MKTNYLVIPKAGLLGLFFGLIPRMATLISSICFVGLFQFLPLSLCSQEDSSLFIFNGGLNEIKNLSIDAYSLEDIAVASSFGSNIYEAPGIISIITDEDIKNAGFRDITDVLNQIPGFSMASDVQNGISFGVRGNWAEEAKLLVMLDGMPLNELSYGTFIVGQRIPLINIKRIEIIRGAGSSKYGGTAALGVINIVTKQAKDISGHRLTTVAGLSDNRYSRTNLSYNYGAIMPNKVEITTMGHISQGKLSNQKYKLPDGSIVNQADSSYLSGEQLYLSIKYKGFSAKQFYEEYYFQATYEPIFSINKNSITHFGNTFSFKKFDFDLEAMYRFQTPWNTLYGDPATYDAQNLLADRGSGGFSFKSKFTLPFQIQSSFNFYNDFFRHQRAGYNLSNGKRNGNYLGFSGFFETVYTNKYFNLNAGARLEQYAYFKPNLAPRISITKKFKYWHYKAIYNRAYKIPALQNINLDVGKEMIPENIQEIQGQLGTHIGKFNLSATLFENRINNLIVFGYNNGVEQYVNSGHITTAGTELELSYVHKKIKLSANYSGFIIKTSTSPEILLDSLNSTRRPLALPTHKAMAKISYSFKENIIVNAQYVFESVKSGVVRVNSSTDEWDLVDFPATHNLNLIAEYRGLFKNLVDVNLGFYNILGTQLSYLYPFIGGYQPLRGMGREFLLNVRFKF